MEAFRPGGSVSIASARYTLDDYMVYIIIISKTSRFYIGLVYTGLWVDVTLVHTLPQTYHVECITEGK